MTIPPPPEPHAVTNDAVVSAADAAAHSRRASTSRLPSASDVATGAAPGGNLPRANRRATCAPYATVSAARRTPVIQPRTCANSLLISACRPQTRTLAGERGLDLQARQQIPALFGTPRIAQHVVAPRHKLHRRAEISCAARHRVGDGRGDQSEEHP